jgi:hypothetical protein
MKKLLEDYMIECVICIIAIILIIFNPHKVAMGLTYAVNMYVNLFLIIVSVS